VLTLNVLYVLGKVRFLEKPVLDLKCRLIELINIKTVFSKLRLQIQEVIIDILP